MKGNMLQTRKVLALMIIVIAGHVSTAGAEGFALSLYGGRMTGENWEDTLSLDTDYRDASVAVVAGAWTINRYFDEALSLELEAQAGRYFGDQDNWEF
ncbi:MAG: hypothetical protein V2I36_14920, partial [Desulfopila sp.]|nr:hypothetical protein [Desulfopila sp.]